MSFLQSVSSLDKTIEGINSILPIVSLWSISQQQSIILQCQHKNTSHKILMPPPLAIFQAPKLATTENNAEKGFKA